MKINKGMRNGGSMSVSFMHSYLIFRQRALLIGVVYSRSANSGRKDGL
jgi:hypothetical protein